VAASLGVVLALYLTMTRVMDVYLPTGVLPF
jgi:putative tricarboxylic transport membrane protein